MSTEVQNTTSSQHDAKQVLAVRASPLLEVHNFNNKNMENQKWKIGNHPSQVVSDTKIQNTNFPSPPNPEFSEDKDIEYYGGYLICESIGNDKIAQLISAAPELLKCMKEAIESLEYERNKAPKEWYEVVAKAEGRLA